MRSEIFPPPQNHKHGNKVYDYSNFRNIIAVNQISSHLMSKLLEFSNECGNKLCSKLIVSAANLPDEKAFLRLLINHKIADQGYILETTPRGIILEASSDAGFYYGLVSLQQIITKTGAIVKHFKIDDTPQLTIRGFMLDISRCKVPKLSEILSLINLLANLKINQLQLYIEHTFAFSKHQQVWFDASPLTAAEIIQIDHYCKEHFIELVPNFNSFGHFERWLRHPDYHDLAECPNGFETQLSGRRIHGSTLKPNQQSLDFLDSLYQEFLPNFSSTKFNICCDETWELGQGWSKKQCEKNGKTKVYLDFLKKIDRLTKKYNRSTMFFGDIILHEPQYIGELPHGITALNWGYEFDHNFAETTEKFAASGVPFYVCPGTSSWNSIIGRTDNALGSINNAVVNGVKNGAVGILNTDWGDNGHHQYLPISYVGIFAGAGYGWSNTKMVNAAIPAAIDTLAFHQPDAGLGEVLYNLGNSYKIFPERTVNNTLFNTMLFANDSTFKENQAIKKLKRTRLVDALLNLENSQATLNSLSLTASEAIFARHEVNNAINMAKFSCTKTLAFFDNKKIILKNDARKQLLDILIEHESLWLTRNRIGGLRESSDKLRGNLIFFGSELTK
jgi:hypothetical protein